MIYYFAFHFDHGIVVVFNIYFNRGIQRCVIYGIWFSGCIDNYCRCWNEHRSDVLDEVSVIIIVK